MSENPVPETTVRHPRFPLVPGIAGGMGPHAHVCLERRLLELAARRFDIRGDADYPDWVVSSVPQTPDRTEALTGRGADPSAALAYSLRRLKAAGADFAAIACNTAHAFLPAMWRAGHVPLPVVHVVLETLAALRVRHPLVRRVGLLATTGTCRSELFARAFGQAGIEVLLPDQAGQESVMTAIYGPVIGGRRAGGIKAGVLDGGISSPRRLLWREAGELVDAGAQAVVVACSEISMAVSLDRSEAAALGAPILDSMDVLADAILDLASGQRPLHALAGPEDWPG